MEVHLTKSGISPSNRDADTLLYGIPGSGLGRSCLYRKYRQAEAVTAMASVSIEMIEYAIVVVRCFEAL